MRREILGGAAQLAEGEVVQVAGEGLRQLLRDPAGARPQAAVGERQLPERRQRRRRRQALREPRLRRPAPADVAEDGVLVGGAAVPRRQRLPLLALPLRLRLDLHFPAMIVCVCVCVVCVKKFLEGELRKERCFGYVLL